MIKFEIIELKSLVVGFALGASFAIFKVPIPAPSNFAGILGILGVYFGYKVMTYWLCN